MADQGSSYEQTLAWLYSLEAKRGIEFKLDRVRRTLAQLGDPHLRYRTVHVAGTNGKGSVCAMLHSTLTLWQPNIGLYTSPHLCDFRERIRCGDRNISESEVIQLTRRVAAAAEATNSDLTFFELTTIVAFLHFAESDVPLAVIEVGMGGRLDATNLVDPEVCVITSIGYDHEEFLGNTIEAIATEKAGIIKPGKPVICGPLPEEAMRVVEQTASANGSPILRYGKDFRMSASEPYSFESPNTRIDDLELSLRGDHQRTNAALAIAALDGLRAITALDSSQVRQGLRQAHWPARLEMIDGAPALLIDGAHNPDGATVLANELQQRSQGRRVHALFAVMQDKRWREMVEILAPCFSSVTITRVLPPRGADPAMVAAAFPPELVPRIAPSASDALRHLLATAAPEDLIVVAGSLFLAAEVYPLVEEYRVANANRRAVAR